MKCPRCRGSGVIDITDRGERLIALREARGVTAKQVEQETGISHPTLWRAERGDEMKVTTLVKLATYYGVTTDEILGVSNGQ